MASHYECIGIDVKDKDEFARLLTEMTRTATELELPNERTFVRWSDPSGAGVGIHVEYGSMQCVVPYFAGELRQRVRVRQRIADEGCRYCDTLVVEVLGDDVEMVYPAVTQVENISLVPAELPDDPVELALVGFAESIELFPDEAAFTAAQTNQKVTFGPRFFAPSGQFNNPVTPHAIIKGEVECAERRRNQLTGADFVRLAVASYQRSYDVVAAARDFPELPAPGSVVSASCWMVTRYPASPVPIQGGFFERLRDKLRPN